MRKLARVRATTLGARWVIVHETEESGTFVFPLSSDHDGSSTDEYWFQSLGDADWFCRDEYGVRTLDWRPIGDPMPDCQQDWISPCRVPGRADGSPRWGELERPIGGEWTVIDASTPPITVEEAIRQDAAADHPSGGR